MILHQFHRYDADTRLIVNPWDEALDRLRQAIKTESEFSKVVLYNFAEYHRAGGGVNVTCTSGGVVLQLLARLW